MGVNVRFLCFRVMYIIMCSKYVLMDISCSYATWVVIIMNINMKTLKVKTITLHPRGTPGTRLILMWRLLLFTVHAGTEKSQMLCL